ncbi:MAG: hypothetical protein ABJO52_07180 [Nisaea sp.]|uniref:hypothetical protein n=1 Tax=Nisaea sp. TaxID=2024842 RepID=UPI003297EAEC
MSSPGKSLKTGHLIGRKNLSCQAAEIKIADISLDIDTNIMLPGDRTANETA